MRKGFAPILIIFVILVILSVGGFTYYSLNQREVVKSHNTSSQALDIKPDSAVKSTPPVSTSYPTQSPTIDISTWKTFVNKGYNWEIKYPPDWTIDGPCGPVPLEQCQNVIFTGTNVSNGKCLDPSLRCGQLQVIATNRGYDQHLPSENTSAKQYVQSFVSGENTVPFGSMIPIEPSQEVNIADRKGYQVTYQNKPGSTAISRTITLIKTTYVYEINATEGYYQDNYKIKSTKDWKLLSTINAIQATFRLY